MQTSRPTQDSASHSSQGIPQINILGTRVDLVPPKSVILKAGELLTSHTPHQIVTANSLMVLEGQKDPELRQLTENASMVVADSVGIIWAARKLKLPVPIRFPGIDLAYQLCSLAEILSVPVYLLGGAPGIAMKAAKFLSQEFPYLHVSGMRDGYFRSYDESTIINDIAKSHSKLVLVALGMPRQEKWIYQRLKDFPPAVYMGVGGTFDVWSGAVPRAPKWAQRKGLEWLFRLSREPQRIGRIKDLPRFAFQVLTTPR